MRISLEDLGKRYARTWVFAGITHTFLPGSRTAILGHNGSGKSTLLRIIAGMQPPTRGRIYYEQGGSLKQEEVFRHVSYCAPGMELPEELSLQEALRFHYTYKPLPAGLSADAIVGLCGLQQAAHKPIGDYSSGMKQRVKLALALFTDTPLLLLDEPCSNLDEAGVRQYTTWLEEYSRGRTTIIASNDPREYPGCDSPVVMSDYQQSR